jgi:hypothetical protein
MSSDRVSQSLTKALTDLRAERMRINQAIEQLHGFIRELATVGPGAVVRSATPRKPVTRNWSASARRAAAERMRRYWAQRRAASKKGAAHASVKRPAKKWTAQARRKAAERMRRYWAQRRVGRKR